MPLTTPSNSLQLSQAGKVFKIYAAATTCLTPKRTMTVSVAQNCFENLILPGQIFLEIHTTMPGTYWIDHVTLHRRCQEFEHYAAQVSSAQDYYPFGMVMPGRSYQGSEGYRYGFNGMEGDDEIAGAKSTYTAQFWQYNPKLGRRWNIDPVSRSWESSYAAFRNNPIYWIDPKGDNPGDHKEHEVKKGETLSGLSEKYGLTPSEIMDANKNIDWDSERRKGKDNWLFTGETLIIPENTTEKTQSIPKVNSDNSDNYGNQMSMTNEDAVYVGGGGVLIGAYTISVDRSQLTGFWENNVTSRKNISYPLELGASIGRGRLVINNDILIKLKTNSITEIMNYADDVISRGGGLIYGGGFYEGYKDNELVWTIIFDGFFSGFSDSFGSGALNEWKAGNMNREDSIEKAIYNLNKRSGDTIEYKKYLKKNNIKN